MKHVELRQTRARHAKKITSNTLANKFTLLRGWVFRHFLRHSSQSCCTEEKMLTLTRSLSMRKCPIKSHTVIADEYQLHGVFSIYCIRSAIFETKLVHWIVFCIVENQIWIFQCINEVSLFKINEFKGSNRLWF